MMKYDYKPLPDCLTIRESSINGLGLFAAEDISKSIKTSSFDGAPIYSRNVLGESHYEIYDDLVRTAIGSFANHSDTPNCYLVSSDIPKVYLMVVMRDIAAGEEITLDYKDAAVVLGMDWEFDFI